MTKINPTKFGLSSVLFILLSILVNFNLVLAAKTEIPREKLSLDAGWKFRLGDNLGLGDNLAKAGDSSGPAKINFNDTSWRTINLPHDWAVELPFDAQADYDHGYKPVGPGFPTNSVGWYRRAFLLTEADHGKTLWLEFDGVYRDCRIFLNGFLLAHHESGYNSFRCDITDAANYDGKNVLAVRVGVSQFEGWFYEGAGIYRHVWLIKTGPLAIAPDGVFVYTSFKNNMPASNAEIHLQTQLLNSQSNSANAKVTWQILDPNERVVAIAQKVKTVNVLATEKFEDVAKISYPVLWSPGITKTLQAYHDH